MRWGKKNWMDNIDNSDKKPEIKVRGWEGEKLRDIAALLIAFASLLISLYAVVTVTRVEGFEDLLARVEASNSLNVEQNGALVEQLCLVEESIDDLNEINKSLNKSNYYLAASINERNDQRKLEMKARSAVFGIVHQRLSRLIKYRVYSRAFLAESNINNSLSLLKEIDSLLSSTSTLNEVLSEDSLFVGWNGFHEQTKFTLSQIESVRSPDWPTRTIYSGPHGLMSEQDVINARLSSYQIYAELFLSEILESKPLRELAWMRNTMDRESESRLSFPYGKSISKAISLRDSIIGWDSDSLKFTEKSVRLYE